MSEPGTAEQPQSSDEKIKKQLFTESLRTKVSAAWDSCVGNFGYCDLSVLGVRLWRSLYDPKNALDGFGDGFGDRVRQGTKDELTQQIPLASGVPPDLEIHLIPAIYEAIWTVDVRSTLFPGAIEQLRLLDKRHDILVWTAGSKSHQEIKLARSGLTDESFEHLKVLYPSEILPITTAINEDKFTGEIMGKVEDFAQGKEIVVVEDRVKNIIKFLEKFPDAKAVWVQQGAHAEKAKSRIVNGALTADEQVLLDFQKQGRVTVIDAIGGLNDAVTQLHPLAASESLAVVCDFDDVLSNNTERRWLDQDAITRTLEKNQWAIAA